jgi:aminoglycoside phosphotransferase (APT) family kinase protein
MPDLTQRDPGEVAAALTRWLATQSPGGPSLEVFDVQAPSSNGFSNETILCRTRPASSASGASGASGASADAGPGDHAGGNGRRLVVRVAPTRHLLFMDAEFSTQYRVMHALSRGAATGAASVPLPPLGAFEEDPQYLGVPFFVMEHVDGLVPADNIPYTLEGWVIEATPDDQERMWWSGIEALAAVHRTDWRSLDLDWLSMSGRGKPGLEQQLSYYRDFLDWSTDGTRFEFLESVWQWLLDNRPEETGDVVLSWGDSRIGNIIWDDFSARAVLDWEMASLAQPELDLGWWLYFDRQFSEGLKVYGVDVPRPAGFPSHEETVERYSELMGRPMRDLFYYEVFSGFRFAVIMYRLSMLVADNDMFEEQDAAMATNNIATQFLAMLLDLDPPA